MGVSRAVLVAILSTFVPATFAMTEVGVEEPVDVTTTGTAVAPETESLAKSPIAPESTHLPQAKNMVLDSPVTEEELVESNPTVAVAADPTPVASPGTGDNSQAMAESFVNLVEDEAQQEPEPQAGEMAVVVEEHSADVVEEPEHTEPAAKPFILLGKEIPPATSSRLAWAPSQSFEGIYSATPVLVVNGAEPGPTLCLTAAVHGDELNGIETVRRVLYNLDAQKLSGAVIGVPIVNLQGFRRASRYLSDRRDLNRFFPGDPDGSSASRIAYSFFHEIVLHCSAIVDLHTGSFYRTNLPQLRADLTNPKVVKMAESFGSTVVLHSDGAEGTLRRAAVEAGIPTITLEAGAPMVLSETDVSHSVKGVHTLLNHLGMVNRFSLWGDPEPVYYNSAWQRAPEGGIVFSRVSLGSYVKAGDLLGTVTNPITNVRTEIRSTYNGRILGMALNQVVQPGFAAYHIGIEAPQEQISEPEEVTADTDVENSPNQLSQSVTGQGSSEPKTVIVDGIVESE